MSSMRGFRCLPPQLMTASAAFCAQCLLLGCSTGAPSGTLRPTLPAPRTRVWRGTLQRSPPSCFTTAGCSHGTAHASSDWPSLVRPRIRRCGSHSRPQLAIALSRAHARLCPRPENWGKCHGGPVKELGAGLRSTHFQYVSGTLSAKRGQSGKNGGKWLKRSKTRV